MRQLHVLNWIIEIDDEATRALQAQALAVIETCSCDYCQNFALASDSLPASLINLLEQLGLSVERPGEIYELCDNKDGTHLYGGWYTIIGCIISGRDTYAKADARFGILDGNVQIGFTTRRMFDRDPRQLHLEFFVSLPWMMITAE